MGDNTTQHNKNKQQKQIKSLEGCEKHAALQTEQKIPRDYGINLSLARN